MWYGDLFFPCGWNISLAAMCIWFVDKMTVDLNDSRYACLLCLLLSAAVIWEVTCYLPLLFTCRHILLKLSVLMVNTMMVLCIISKRPLNHSDPQSFYQQNKYTLQQDLCSNHREKINPHITKNMIILECLNQKQEGLSPNMSKSSNIINYVKHG